MSTLKTHNLQSPDAGSVNIALTANAGMIVTGISTFNDQINIGSLGVTTNFTVAGVSTFSGDVNVAQSIVHIGDTDTLIEFGDNTITFDTAGSERLRIESNGNTLIKNLTVDVGSGSGKIDFGNINGPYGRLYADSSGTYVGSKTPQNLKLRTNNIVRVNINTSGHLYPEIDSSYDLGLTGTRFRNVYADTYYGDGANLTNLPAGAPVGGASTNTVFFENDKLVEVGYQITSTKNAMSAGPVSISAGIAVTVPSGCSWTIV